MSDLSHGKLWDIITYTCIYILDEYVSKWVGLRKYQQDFNNYQSPIVPI